MKKYIIVLITLALMACTTKQSNNSQPMNESLLAASEATIIPSKPKHSSRLTLPTIFSDHMILQREKPITIWGWGKKNAPIKVVLSANEQKISATTQVNEHGKWLVTLPAQPTGNTHQLMVSSNEERLTIKDVLIGDVWLASGQSNMEWKLGWQVNHWQTEVANSTNNHIRFFEVPNAFQATEQESITSGAWQIASPKTAANFSAVAWYFAKLHNAEKNVPVAIIDSTWGGTPAEAWLSLPALSKVSGYQKQATNMLNNVQKWQEKFEQNSKNEALKWTMIADESYYANGKVLSLHFDDSAWQSITLPTPPEQPLTDIVWLRKEFTLDGIPQTAEINLGELNQIGKVFLNGELIYQESWQDTTKVTTIATSALKQGKNILALRVINSWDNKVIVGKTDNLWFKFDGKLHDLQGIWRFSNHFEPKLPSVKNYNWEASVLYNAMINPITHYAIKGVIWYQGESNTDRPELYADLFKALIQDWRIQFKQPQLPFLFVQLASYMKQQAQPKESKWAQLRQAQTDALSLPNTAMAVTLDIGDANDIHPRNKETVGKRLWLAAKHIAFNEQNSYSGPVFSAVKMASIQGKTGLLITYKNAIHGLTHRDDKLQGFAIAGKQGNYVNAKAQIIADKIFVYHPKISQPTRVRYGWADNSNANLYNKHSLPAVPFQAQLIK